MARIFSHRFFWRSRSVLISIVSFLILFYTWVHWPRAWHPPASLSPPAGVGESPITWNPAQRDGGFRWRDVPLQHPIPQESLQPLPVPLAGGDSRLGGGGGNHRTHPKIQYDFIAAAASKHHQQETTGALSLRQTRLALIKNNFTHAWRGYKDNAWTYDEVRPVSGMRLNAFGGWGATLVDSLDTLWIMGLHSEFDAAVLAVGDIDFTRSSIAEINVFETTIRFLGGLLAAYDITGLGPGYRHAELLVRKAVEVGDMLMLAFDTPNHLPITHWNLRRVREWQLNRTAAISLGIEPPPTPPGDTMLPSASTVVAELGSLTLEFARLSQISGDPRYFDAVQRVMELFAHQQDSTRLPGLWPTVVDARTATLTAHGSFTLGGMADSLYEYLPKTYLLIGGDTNNPAAQTYRKMYAKALSAMKRRIFYRPRAPGNPDVLLAGDALAPAYRKVSESWKTETKPRAQHLGCFAGGMVALAARTFGLPEAELDVARRLVGGCLWGYEESPAGIMPEEMITTRCESSADDECVWEEHTAAAAAEEEEEEEERPDKTLTADDDDRHLDPHAATAGDLAPEPRLWPGVVKIEDSRYLLRPEAIESVFVLYRLTGDESLRERGWRMFETITSLTQTDIAHSGLADCTAEYPRAGLTDRMESFWLAETLKYFYLLFSEPDVVSLDEYVLNTEAHPLRMPW